MLKTYGVLWRGPATLTDFSQHTDRESIVLQLSPFQNHQKNRTFIEPFLQNLKKKKIIVLYGEHWEKWIKDMFLKKPSIRFAPNFVGS